MQQQENLEFQSLLHQARMKTMTPVDVVTLNQQVTQYLSLSDSLDSVCVARANQCCHHINQLQIQNFAEAQEQDIYIFSADHSQIKIKHDGLRIDELLEIQNEIDNAKEPDLFLYTQEMLIVILYNVCTSLELVNEVKDIAAGIVLDLNSMPSISLNLVLTKLTCGSSIHLIQ